MKDTQASISNGFVMKIKRTETVKKLKIKKYLGKWYEVARMPNWFQGDNKILSPFRVGKNATAEYQLISDNKLSVVNTHRLVWRNNFLSKLLKSKLVRSIGTAVSRKHEKSQITVDFNIFTRIINYIKQKLEKQTTNYLVVYVSESEEQYEHSIVISPDKKYAWILSRKDPWHMSDEDIEDVLDLLHELEFRGVDINKLVMHDKLL